MKIIKGGLLVLPDGIYEGDIALEDSRIKEIGEDIIAGEDDQVFDAKGCWVFPGFIDAHTHMQCWTGMDWTADSFETGTRAAACGGTTCIVDYATQDKGMTLNEALEEWHKRADGTCTSNYAFHMAISDWNEKTKEELSDMQAGGVCSYKTYLAYDHLRLDDYETLDVLENLKRLNATLCVHCENGTLINEYQKRVFDQGFTGPVGHVLSRPAVCEAEAISRFLYLAHQAGDARANVVHLSTEAGLQAIRDARGRGQKNIFVETCPQYLLLDDRCYNEQGDDGFAGAKYVMSPPLRKTQDVEALREAVLKGEIDTIATDHCSFNLHGQKDRGVGDFRKIPNGGPGIEHRPALIATIFADEMTPSDLCRLMSENPARVFGMYPQKGCLELDSDADICVWDPKKHWVISAETQHQNVDYTPYEGFEVTGQAKYVFVNGELVAEDGEPTGATPGTYVSR